MTYSLKEFQKTDVDKVAKSQAKLLILAKTIVLYKGRNKRGFRYFLGKPKMRNICCNIVSCYTEPISNKLTQSEHRYDSEPHYAWSSGRTVMVIYIEEESALIISISVICLYSGLIDESLQSPHQINHAPTIGLCPDRENHCPWFYSKNTIDISAFVWRQFGGAQSDRDMTIDS